MEEHFTFLLIFAGVGATLLLIAAFVMFSVRRFVREALRAQGEVIDLVGHRGGKGGTTYAPVIVFTTQTGRHQFTDPVRTNPPGYSVGDRVEVLYHWQDHGRARVNSTFRLYFVPGLLGFLGLIFSTVGVVLFFAFSAGAPR